MAGPGETNGDYHPHDVAVHREGYEAFLGWAKWGTLASFIVAAVVVVIIAS